MPKLTPLSVSTRRYDFQKKIPEDFAVRISEALGAPIKDVKLMNVTKIFFWIYRQAARDQLALEKPAKAIKAFKKLLQAAHGVSEFLPQRETRPNSAVTILITPSEVYFAPLEETPLPTQPYILRDILSGLEEGSARFQSAVSDSSNSVSPTALWEGWVCALRQIYAHAGYDIHLRTDSDKSSEPTSGFVRMIEMMQGLLPKSLTRHGHSYWGLNQAIRRACKSYPDSQAWEAAMEGWEKRARLKSRYSWLQQRRRKN